MFPFDTARRQARTLERVEHRPWPPPAGRWLVGQTWERLFFAHWPVEAEALRPRIPGQLELEERDGAAWLGIVPCRVTGLRSRGTLPLPLVSSFLELNVRTYVRAADGKAGVWFFSLDATNRLVVRAARRQYRLPYFDARITLDEADGWTDVECARLGERGKVFSGRYRPTGAAAAAAPGSLEWFLTERYCLYTSDAAGLYRAEIHHPPWRLREAEAEIDLTSIAPLELRGEPVCHVAERQDVVAWPLERI
ncbi:MAG TPA: DUF2071 domain-containing protein [Gaiellaceae bacterium]|nr:DUF2071 domain-containing protein [Gaiellaceae bacterium]